MALFRHAPLHPPHFAATHIWLIFACALAAPTLSAAEPNAEVNVAVSARRAQSIADITAEARDSVVVITYTGRDGAREGLGAGFVVARDGLVATNYHVIGEARPITVETADGRRHTVTEIHASDRNLDLAVLRVATTDLPALELGDSDDLADGQSVVAIGNPHGLNRSVVSGVVSGRRKIDGLPLIQLAIPIEPGNSGGPLLDRWSRVQGILTMKSAVTANLGFALEINALKPLLEQPNPIPIDRWLTIGALDARNWSTRHGARWRQRAGHITVEGAGDGFGGRSLCLSQLDVPERPYEVAVTVRLDDEAGAAGLVFEADGGDAHYGFYPTAGKLRLTRFEGPDVFSWTILEETSSRDYRAGDWNTIKVRLEDDKILCYVNDALVIESSDAALTSGRVGLAKFRDTKAEFKGFRLAREIAATAVDDSLRQRIERLTSHVADGGDIRTLADELADDAPAASIVVRDRARELAAEAERLERLAATVHERSVQRALVRLVESDDDEIDLVRAALWIARLDNAEVDVDGYADEVQRMADEVRRSLGEKADDAAKIDALNKYLYDESGFHGSRGDYYNPANSYFNEVLDDREGLPITLSILYIGLARELDLSVAGIGLPGHFLVELRPAEGEPYLIDAFDRGRRVSEEEAAARALEATGQPIAAEHRASASAQSIVVRMLSNLLGAAIREEEDAKILRYLDTILAIDGSAAQEHWMRAVVRYRTSDVDGARADADWLDDHRPSFLDPGWLVQFRQMLDDAR